MADAGARLPLHVSSCVTWASSLRVVGRQRSATAERLQLDQVLLELEPLLRHIAGEVALHFDLDAARSAVHVPRAHLEQLIVGITVHALGRTGAPVSLTMRTRVFPVSGLIMVENGTGTNWPFWIDTITALPPPMRCSAAA